MADTIHEELLLKGGSLDLNLATSIIYSLTSLAVYAGIILVSHHFADETNHNPGDGYMGASMYSTGPIDPTTQDPNYWQRNGIYPGSNIEPKNQVQIREADAGAPPAYYGQNGQGWQQVQSHGYPQWAPQQQQQQQQQQGVYQHQQPGVPQQQQYGSAQHHAPVSPISPHEMMGGSNVPEMHSPPPQAARSPGTEHRN